MPEFDFGERTQPPTERRRREARARGEFAHSADLTAAVGLLAISGTLWFCAPQSAKILAEFLRRSLITQVSSEFDGTNLLNSAANVMLGIIWPFAVAAVIAGLLGNLVQTGWVWLPTAILRRNRSVRMFSSGHFAESLGRLLRLFVAATVTWRFLITNQLPLRLLGTEEPLAVFVRAAVLVGELCMQLSICFLTFALIDYGVRYWRYELGLRMTVEERRREQREQETPATIRRGRAALRNLQADFTAADAIERIGVATE